MRDRERIRSLEREVDKLQATVDSYVAADKLLCAKSSCIQAHGAKRDAQTAAADAIDARDELRKVLAAVLAEADLMLQGGEEMMRLAEQCTECGCGGVGPLRDALLAARVTLGKPVADPERHG